MNFHFACLHFLLVDVVMLERSDLEMAGFALLHLSKFDPGP